MAIADGGRVAQLSSSECLPEHLVSPRGKGGIATLRHGGTGRLRKPCLLFADDELKASMQDLRINYLMCSSIGAHILNDTMLNLANLSFNRSVIDNVLTYQPIMIVSTG